MHGIISREPAYMRLEKFIREAHNGTQVHLITSHQGLKSIFTSMEEQLEAMTAEIERIKRDHEIREHHLLCFSQGTLLCRAYLMRTPDHRVRNFISLSGPIFGEYGLTMLASWIPGPWVLERAWKVMYSEKAQNSLSIANYWRDPFNYDVYLANNTFLPRLNNETHNTRANEHRENFLQISKLILIGGPHDGVIEPWQSSIFGFYEIQQDREEDERYQSAEERLAKTRIVPMEEQMIYKEDTFGLRTLNEQGRLHVHVMEKVIHVFWTKSRRVFDECIVQYLD